jgi:hypothetical protein
MADGWGKCMKNYLYMKLFAANRGVKSVIAVLFTMTLTAQAAHANPNGLNIREAHPSIKAESVAHYARSRALLIKAINEFDKGRALAKPDELIDSVKWRNTLIDRAEDLEKVLDPQPRVTKGGIYFEADSRLLPEARR